MVPQLQSLRYDTNRWAHARGQPPNCQKQLVLLRLEIDGTRCFSAKAQELTNCVAQLGQCLVVAEGNLAITGHTNIVTRYEYSRPIHSSHDPAGQLLMTETSECPSTFVDFDPTLTRRSVAAPPQS